MKIFNRVTSTGDKNIKISRHHLIHHGFKPRASIVKLVFVEKSFRVQGLLAFVDKKVSHHYIPPLHLRAILRPLPHYAINNYQIPTKLLYYPITNRK